MSAATIWLGIFLLVLLGILWRYAVRLKKLEQWQQEREGMERRIKFLEGEIKAIKGSIPFQVFSNGKTG